MYFLHHYIYLTDHHYPTVYQVVEMGVTSTRYNFKQVNFQESDTRPGSDLMQHFQFFFHFVVEFDVWMILNETEGMFKRNVMM